MFKAHCRTQGERRLRGDLIETFKIVNKLVEYGNGMFRLSRSNNNIIRKAINSNNNYDSYVSKLRSYFLPERVRNYWNNLPEYVKFSADVPSFKINLESFKGGGGGFSPDFCKNTILRYELAMMARTCTNNLRVVFSPYVQHCPCEASEQKWSQKTNI